MVHRKDLTSSRAVMTFRKAGAKSPYFTVSVASAVSDILMECKVTGRTSAEATSKIKSLDEFFCTLM
jgi:hypothetical protein